ncbi:MAG: glucuronate isomerase [Bacteroidetes bacterium]|nr:glucuronate isomerase [Bacteroidota bacterium]
MTDYQNHFLSADFLLFSQTAKKLYHDHVVDLPIIDYHNHLPPAEIADNKKFSNLTEIWLKGDHYKWRAMRTLGIDEKWITGNGSDKEKFKTWARCVPKTLRNPLFHWTHMELKNPFGINQYLNEDTAEAIYSHCNEQLRHDSFSTKGLLQHFKVEMVCTTDDPIDDLRHHKKLVAGSFGVKILPGFRPDKALNIAHKERFLAYIQSLSHVTSVSITGMDSLLEALHNRIDYFEEAGCTIADHGLVSLPANFAFTKELEKELEWFLKSGNDKPFSQPEAFSGFLLKELCKIYHQKKWVQQFHLGALRNNNTRMFGLLGPDTGFDSIGDYTQAERLSVFLNELDKTNELGKTVIYNLNPADNEVFASMVGNFNDGSIKGKIQFGSGWWFLDQKDGMEKQLNALSNMGLISTFIGMLTDSRSFLSFPRHEYFRRILCNIFGEEMENGILPNDEKWIAGIIKGICYDNAKEYFNL